MIFSTGGGFTSKRGLFGKVGKLSSMMSVCYGMSVDMCYSGGVDGKIYHWIHNTLKRTVPAHKGPVYAVHRVDKVCTVMRFIVHWVQGGQIVSQVQIGQGTPVCVHSD